MDIEAYISSGILEAYVLGQATAEEAAIVECIAKNNTRVQEVLAELSLTLEKLADMHAVAPPPDLKAAIRNRLHFPEITADKTAAGPLQIPLPQPTFPEKQSPAPSPVWKVVALAASLLFLLSAGGFFYTCQQQERTVVSLSQAEKTLADNKARLDYYQTKEYIIAQPGMELVMLKGVEKHPEAKAMVMWNRNTQEVFLDAINLPQVPSGKQYQLWAMIDGKPISAGMYNNAAPLQPLSSMDTAQAFAITLEKEGGVASPTMENLMVMGAVKG